MRQKTFFAYFLVAGISLFIGYSLGKASNQEKNSAAPYFEASEKTTVRTPDKTDFEAVYKNIDLEQVCAQFYEEKSYQRYDDRQPNFPDY